MQSSSSIKDFIIIIIIIITAMIKSKNKISYNLAEKIVYVWPWY